MQSLKKIKLETMIVILSRKADGSTSDVIEWLIAMKKDFIRINADDNNTKFIEFDLNKKQLIVEQFGKNYNLLDATSYWYRRKGFSKKMLANPFDSSVNDVLEGGNTFVYNHLQSEINSLIYFMYHALEDKCKTLGKFENSSLNKMAIMQLAEKYGMAVPRSYVVTSKQRLKEILETEGKAVVTKALENGVYHLTRKRGYYSYTEKLNIEALNNLPDQFFPSLIQVEIKKKFELRVFYLKGLCYPMAIFSQIDPTTSVDFRKYNTKKPNRTVPYKLPREIEEKLHLIMVDIKLDTGSFDIIVDQNGQYVFLEVNPIGQFSMTSIPCNYYLERRIAQAL